MYRAILLQTEATSAKKTTLAQFMNEATACANWMLTKRKSRRLKDMWDSVSADAKRTTGFNIQVICDLVRSVLKYKASHIDAITVKFNIPRNCKMFRTNRFLFVDLGLYPRSRIAIPIRKNRNFDRFLGLVNNGWTCKACGLTPSLEVVAYLSKVTHPIVLQPNVMGIDVNKKHIAASIVSPDGRILYQTYFGKRIWLKRNQIAERRALLQSLGAQAKLDRLKRRERNFVKTNLGQIIGEIVKLSKRFNADISIEMLRRFKPKGKRFNRNVMHIPFRLFRKTLEARCFDGSISLTMVNPWHTSKWCIRCGAAGAGHSSANYAMFRCANCGLVMNADRKASVAIAVKSLLERNRDASQNTFQISGRRVPVMALVSSNEAPPQAVPRLAVADESPRLRP